MDPKKPDLLTTVANAILLAFTVSVVSIVLGVAAGVACGFWWRAFHFIAG